MLQAARGLILTISWVESHPISGVRVRVGASSRRTPVAQAS